MFAAPPVIKTEIFARLPDALRARQNPREQSGVPRDSFLEPASAGNQQALTFLLSGLATPIWIAITAIVH